MRKIALCLLTAMVACWAALSHVPLVYADTEGDFTYSVADNLATITDYPRGASTDVAIPDTLGGYPVVAIDETAFYITDLNSVSFPSSLTSIGNNAFGYNFLTSVDLPDSLTYIGERAFKNNLLTSLVMPDSITSMEQEAFSGNALTHVDISRNLTSISDFAFRGNQLTSVVIPESVTSIGGYSFRYNQLSSVTVLNGMTVIDPLSFNNNQAIPADLKMFSYAGSRVQSYAASKGFTFVDGTMLFEAIKAARQLLHDRMPGTAVGQVPTADYNDLKQALSDAESFVNAITQSNVAADLQSEAAELVEAIQAFNDAIVTPDMTELHSVLDEANQALIDHAEGTEVGEASVADRTAMQAAIAEALLVSDDAANRTQAQVDAAADDLIAALDVFMDAVIQAGDAAALEAALDEANQALTDHPEGSNVGQASAAARSVLQAAIELAQAVSDDAANQTQAQIDAAITDIKDAIEQFDAAWIALEVEAPADRLYGKAAILPFTVKYGYQVIVTGTPRIPLIIGTGSTSEVVYASYTGAQGVPVTELSFAYAVTEGIEDEDGISIAPQLDLPSGAGIVRVSSGTAASIEYAVPDTSLIRVAAIPPNLVLSAVGSGGATMDVDVVADIYGAAAGNTLAKLRWLPGSHSVVDFAEDIGADILAAKQFTVRTNGAYTVYASDGAGNETIKEISVTGIVAIVPGSGSTGSISPSTATIKLGGVRTEVRAAAGTSANGQSVKELFLTSEQLEKAFAAGNGDIVIAIDGLGSEIKVNLPAAALLNGRNGAPDAIVQVIVNEITLEIPLRSIGDITGKSMFSATIAQAPDTAKEAISLAAKQMGAELMLDRAVVFLLDVDGKALNGGNQAAAKQIIKLSAAVDANKATAVWMDASNKLHFAPSQFGNDGTVTIHSLHNGVYAMIQSNRIFKDLQGHWARVEIELLANKLIVDGRPDGGFAPDHTITRAEFSALLVRALGLPELINEELFTDVKTSSWYAGAIGAAQQAGLIDGFEGGAFRPNASITREQMAVMIARAITYAGQTKQAGNTGVQQSFTDGADISEWAIHAIDQLVGLSIIQGVSDKTFAPQANATRAQSAVMLKRLLQYLQYMNS
ncbi:hypothetical protein FHS16_004096 [Paenibacillus endophyticus]|uniref:SLH domain-containing protein n=1 Tax=Paenibacillus endophyticus TaxID=1294268 RepID=A0A7W5CB43_9BACL|nr:S-layer homology domain-containing protein [Paenibacillus endophyticus]MBB3154020.1 hypothetical protein [Paenibacillus endophyticus]